MRRFIYAAELKKTFRCYGHFYRLNIEGTNPLLCRSVLEITSLPREALGAGTDPDDLFTLPDAKTNLPDAIAIMMNPGGSRALEEGDTDSRLTMPLSGGFKKPLVLTRPDVTQYQLMRIAASKGWKHIRVLNISDLRNPKSPSFIAQTQHLSTLSNGETHSLFCDTRTVERMQMLRRKPGAPLILGWGQYPGLIPLAEQCLSCIEGEKIVTVPSENNPILTAHPSPMMQAKKEEWLDAIRQKLK